DGRDLTYSEALPTCIGPAVLAEESTFSYMHRPRRDRPPEPVDRALLEEPFLHRRGDVRHGHQPRPLLTRPGVPDRRRGPGGVEVGRARGAGGEERPDERGLPVGQIGHGCGLTGRPGQRRRTARWWDRLTGHPLPRRGFVGSVGNAALR